MRAMMAITGCLLVVGTAQADDRIKELKDRHERALRTKQVEVDVAEERLQRVEQRLKVERERFLQLHENAERLQARIAELMREQHEHSVRQEERNIRMDELLRRVEAMAEAAEARAEVASQALIEAHAALRAAGQAVPGEAQTRKQLRATGEYVLPEGTRLDAVARALSETAGVSVLVLGPRAACVGVEAFRTQGSVEAILDAITAATGGRVRWRVEGRCVVFSAVPR